MKRAFNVVAVAAACLCIAGSALAQQQAPELPAPSPKAKVEQRVGLTDVSVEYSSPGSKGRVIWGGLVPYDVPWRTGANAPTRLTASKAFKFAGTAVPAGSYALYTIPTKGAWTVLLSNSTEGWMGGYDAKTEVARVSIKPVPLVKPRERMTFIFSETTDDATRLDLEWAKLRLSIPLGFDTKAQAAANIDAATGDAWRPHFASARFLLENNGDIAKALEYVNASIAIKGTWWNHWVRAQIVAKQGQVADAIATAEKAQQLGVGDRIFEFFKADIEKALGDWKEEALSVPRSLQDAYVAGSAQAFYPSHFASAEARRTAVAEATRPLADEVARALVAQNARYAASPARDAHLAALCTGAAAVVTGQQVGLLLGPLYTIYKAATAIVAARALAAESGKPVVPVFWLQTEDHDLREIASVHVPTSAGSTLTLSLPASEEHRCSIATCALPTEVSNALQAIEAELAHFPNAAPHLARLRQHYVPGVTYGAAFAQVLAALFADEGLVLLDPRDAQLAQSTSHVHRRALQEHSRLAQALSQRSETLHAQGFAEGVHVRTDATLSFFHADGPAAPRARLRVQGEQFFDGERAYTLSELLATLEREPLAFSTSALLRPLLQDTLLPTVMYVGGPAEVAYFAQLSPLYAAFGMRMPIILPRARFVVVDDKTQRLLTRLSLSCADATLAEDALLAKLAARDPAAEPADALARRLGDCLCTALDAELQSLGTLPTEVAASVEKTRATLRASVERLAHKHERACANADQARVADVRRLQHLLCPGGAPQERVYGVSHYAARFGEQAFVDAVIAGVQPFDVALRELKL